MKKAAAGTHKPAETTGKACQREEIFFIFSAIVKTETEKHGQLGSQAFSKTI